MVTGVKKVVPISAMIGTLLLTPVSWASTAPVTHLTEADAKVENLKVFSQSPENTEMQPAEPVTGVTALPLNDVADSIRREVPAATPLLYTDTLTNIYAEHQLKPLWTDEKARLSLENQLAEAALAGFQPQFTAWLNALAQPDLTPLARDMILTDAALGYLYYLDNVGTKGDKWLYGARPFTFSAVSEPSLARLNTAAHNGTLAAFTGTLLPANKMYQPMRKAMLAQLADTVPWPEMVINRTLRPGESHESVGALREILHRFNLISANDMMSAGAAYDKTLVAAVKEFQLQHGLEADGVIGKQTREWLNKTPQMRAAIMAVNIQRLRITPDNQPTAILVNIPDFSLYFYVDNNLILESRTIVGRAERKTPIMSSALNNVVINPPWTVPPTMSRQDIVPRGRADPSYFSSRGYTIYNGWSNNASVIDPYSIDWSVITPSNFPYRITQAPGPSNSLGRYKFNMPNSEAIYLHDTPNHSLFNKNMRAISSGCVRVNKAKDLAAILLGDAGWNETRVDGALKAGSTRYVSIPNRIPVYLYYQTAWVNAENIPQYRADIYRYDDSSLKGIDKLTDITPFLIKS
ncbi:L,D-transpeptidase [Morganella morganii]|uniref:L,D-transpeptidase n=1 Tax=Morganella morganii TaxID=582 RepID=UPI001E5A86DC|nr:L,D-transpeptidase [Morganella morganii]EKU5842543.1 L,D-transpeptidase [Morganella morganii]UFH67420.1 L,D-transpeptidase [Morganella morganii]WNP31776.1 L,D-transpeptidase [Morganella morganii]